MKLDFNTVVIGAGVSGMTAAMYLKRSNIDVVILEKSAPGGQINRNGGIENYPGFEKIEGPELAMNIFHQINKLGIEYRYGDVQTVTDFDEYKIIKTDVGEIICQNIIIATGRRPKELGLTLEKQLSGRGVSWCAICDGPLYKNKIVAVVGGGNSAISEAQYLSTICSKVYLIHRRDHFRADAIEQAKLKKHNNIEVLYNTVITNLNQEDDHLASLVVKTNEEIEEIKVDGLFIYVGYEPDTKFLKGLPIHLENDYLIVNERMQTNVRGIYACGDVIKKEIYQISTAIGEGAIAALSVKKDIQ